MGHLRLLIALIAITSAVCWTAPFNWHFLPKHYRLYSNLTVDRNVLFDTDCGTLAADSGATHFLWDPESGLCSISTGLTDVEFSVANEQDSKTSFYYVRDFALVVPPGSPNCPTEPQLRRMIDNLRPLNGPFTVGPDPTRRTWRDECKKNEQADVTPGTTTAAKASPTKAGAGTALLNVSSITTPIVNTDSSSPMTSPYAVDVGLAKTESAASPPTSTRSETPSAPDSSTTASTASPTESGTTVLNVSSITSPVTTTDTIPARTSLTAVDEVGSANTVLSATSPGVSTRSTTPSDVTNPGLPTASAAAPCSMANTLSPVSNPFTSDTTAKTTTFAATAEDDSVTNSPATSGSTRNDNVRPSSVTARDNFTSLATSKTTTFTPTDTTMDEGSVASTATSTSPAVTLTASAVSNVPETQTTPTLSQMHADTTSWSTPAVHTTRYMTTAWEPTKKSDPVSALSRATSISVRPAAAGSTSSVPTQKSRTTTSVTITTDTTTSALPASSATVRTRCSVKTTVPNGKTSRATSTASSTVKTPATTKRTTTPTRASTTRRTSSPPSTTKKPADCKSLEDLIRVNPTTNTTPFTDALGKLTMSNQDKAAFESLKKRIEGYIRDPLTMSQQFKLQTIANEVMKFTDALSSRGSAQAYDICAVKIGSWGSVTEFVACAMRILNQYGIGTNNRTKCDLRST